MPLVFLRQARRLKNPSNPRLRKCSSAAAGAVVAGVPDTGGGLDMGGFRGWRFHSLSQVPRRPRTIMAVHTPIMGHIPIMVHTPTTAPAINS